MAEFGVLADDLKKDFADGIVSTILELFKLEYLIIAQLRCLDDRVSFIGVEACRVLMILDPHQGLWYSFTQRWLPDRA